ncbi:dimethyl sulfoxide reductase anchor subunit family protein [Cognatilysobacter bugurensis]|uniref:DMSO reductase n=1 Tax=Cognatilysobacter bugurensis TaxID=543356 RepID=A0A918W9V0_9GAMM|nr:DmsC/YnfH family molybdoenzyme membrane anchor subunit [Lysobacter bugurensis]GHA82697.1 DMSO reductase [Lysobacter bugurensis]
MNPAFSVIVFSTLSGTGYGLLALIALATLMQAAPARTLLVLLPIALALVTIGLLSSLAHLGKPQRAWRAFSQWRTSWLSREGVFAVATYVPAFALAAALLPQAIDGGGVATASRGNAWAMLAAALTLLGAIATVVCTAMIYASLKPVPAWRHALVLPGYLLFALLGGAAVLVAGLAVSGGAVGFWAALLALSALVALVIKPAYWRAIDASPLPLTRGDAVGLPQRDVRVFERPHTQGNFLTHEMGFVLARKHARRLRMIALVLFGAVPLLAVALALAWPASAPAALPFAAFAALIGTFVERWLFFAQARHLVALYY